MVALKRNLPYKALQVCRCDMAGLPITLTAADGLLVGVHAGALFSPVLREALSVRIPVMEFSRETLLMESVDVSLLPLQAGIMQLEEYFAGTRRSFHLPIAPAGTEFQQKVWEALCAVPYGETCSYGQIAGNIGCPNGARAVGLACHANPLLIVIPCHRIVGRHGALTGFAGGLEMKQKLLELEHPGLLF